MAKKKKRLNKKSRTSRNRRNAKIMTVGERAEDVFFITTHTGQPLPDNQRAQLEQALLAALEDAGPL